MTESKLLRALGYLIIFLMLGASASYFVTIILVETGFATPAAMLSAATAGLKHVGRPYLALGMHLGIDKTLLIFLANLAATWLIVVSFFWVTMLNPDERGKRHIGLRRMLQRDGSAKLLQTVGLFREIWSPQLRLTAFLLLSVPLAGTMMLGFLTGTMIGAARYIFGSHLLAFAYIVPHGCFELTAMLLACSIPLGTWLTIRNNLLRGRLTVVFVDIDRFRRSSELQIALKSIISLLWIASVIETQFTQRVVDLARAI